MRTPVVATMLLVCAALQAAAPITREPIVLWSGAAPGAVGTEDADIPTLTPYVPAKAAGTGAAVVICPGGGYARLAADHEGRQIAEWFNGHGVMAFVLKYRLGHRYRHPAMLNDAQRAVRYVRANAGRYDVRPDRIVLMGFSAGGHLASTAATHIAPARVDASDPVERVSSRPDFLVLGYPVVSLIEAYVHRGSRDHLVGPLQHPDLLAALSNERHVTRETPPTFLFHTNADEGVPAENSVAFYLALRRAGVPAELHIYQQGGHGVGFAPKDPILSTWPERLADWLRVHGVLAQRSASQ
jgi:acetyl esterase/lipase